jgi:hypothetical protein
MRLADRVLAWLVHATLALAFAVTVARRGALGDAPSLALLAQPPSESLRTERVAAATDLSAGVRVHRGDHTLDVWMVTPHSVHWTAAAVAPPLADQLFAAQWPPHATEKAVVRFERLTPAMRPLLRPQYSALRLACR